MEFICLFVTLLVIQPFVCFGGCSISSTDKFSHPTACSSTPYIQNCNGTLVPWPVTKYCNATSFFQGVPILPIEVGYAIVLGFGIFFSIFTSFLVWFDQKIVKTQYTSEYFNTAGRTVRTGLTAAVIVSQWTWAATLLQSSNKAFSYGVSGPFWYASGATVQILLFGILAVELKKKAPNAHTMCEIIAARWGKTAHKVFLGFALLTNIIVTAMLLLGGAAVVNALTGMDTNLAIFLIPIGVIAYTMSGGLKATFLASYIHTAIIFIILLSFVCVVYMTSPELGSPKIVYERLQSISSIFPVEDNEGGSYVTMLSGGGFTFGVINLVGNFGTVFCDQSYWQSAIAAKPSAAHKGYLLGGMVWFTIPFALATSLGLSSVALDLPITVDEANAGLVAPAAAVHFWGTGGAVAMATMLFMAITSTGSAELIAVSSLLVYDVYRVYINPEATSEQILKWSRIIIAVFGIFMGLLAVILSLFGWSLDYVYQMMGILIGSTVVPISYVLFWRKATAVAAMTGALLGSILAIISWLVSASIMYGEVTLKSTGNNWPMLIGNLVSILGSAVICTTMSLLNPDDYDFKSLKDIELVGQENTKIEEDTAELETARKWNYKFGVAVTLMIVVIWPIFSLPAGIFSLGYFTFWVIISIVWSLIATVVIIILPLYEARQDMMTVLKEYDFI